MSSAFRRVFVPGSSIHGCDTLHISVSLHVNQRCHSHSNGDVTRRGSKPANAAMPVPQTTEKNIAATAASEDPCVGMN